MVSIPNFNNDGVTYSDRLAILDILAGAVSKHAPKVGGLNVETEYPAYLSVTIDGVTDDEGTELELCLGFSDDSRGTAFSWDCPQVSSLSGVIDLVDNTYDGVAQEFWAQVFGNCLSLVGIHVGGA